MDATEIRRIALRFMAVLLVVLLILTIGLEIIRTNLMPEDDDTVFWLQIIIGLAMAVLFTAWLVKARKSRVKAIPEKETYYQGRAIHLANLIATGVLLSVALPLVIADVMFFPPGSYPGVSLASIGVLYLAMALLALINGLQTTLHVLEEGLVLREGITRFSSYTFISFDRIESLALTGWVFSYKEDGKRFKRRLIVRNPTGLARALSSSWRRS